MKNKKKDNIIDFPTSASKLERQVEAILFAAHHELDNLKVIVDYNKLQSLDTVKNTLNLEPLKEKIEAFNWNFQECNGHNHEELNKTFKYKTSLKKHTFLHTGERPFSCSICQKSFTSSSDLKTQARAHGSDKPFRCSHQDCAKAFKSKCALKNHLLLHTDK